MRSRRKNNPEVSDWWWVIGLVPVIAALIWQASRRKQARLAASTQTKYQEPDSIPLDMSGYMDRKPAARKQSQPGERPTPRTVKPIEPKSQPHATSKPVEVENDDLKRIEGIGPAITQLLYQSGIHTFHQLSNTPEARLREILAEAGLSRLSNPETWPEQARLAASGKWDELQQLQDSLTAGRRRRKE
jgi:predicted flap endonuclease-1-like 5' DNA nuclease